MQQAAKQEDYKCTINAYPLSSVKKVVAQADVMLLGPQVRFKASDLASQYPEKKIAVIDMRAYGMMNGKVVLDQARKLLGD
jgi:PTS system cellobiose-specific IIB component